MIALLIKAGILCLCFFLGVILTFGTGGIIQNIGIILFVVPILIVLFVLLKLIFSIQLLTTLGLAAVIFVLICIF